MGTLKSAETLAKLRIARTQGIGPATFRKLMLRYENATDIVAEWGSLSDKNGKKFPQICAEDAVLRECESVAKFNGVLMLQDDDDYPAQLRELPDAPLVLTVLGDAATLKNRQVAIVGNRSASASGLTWTKQLAAEIARQNVVLTSGLARGIDTAAHEGAIAAGGLTIAVVAGGADNVYPPENAKLREAIIAHGCVVSEQAWGMQPTAHLFPRRNRIIAGLSIGVVVSEATRHSGSLITAECALNYNREVWAVPGSPTDARSAGPNWLLKNGATLIENAQDVMKDLPNSPAPFVPHSLRAQAQQELFVTSAIVVESKEEEPVGELSTSQIVFGLLGSVPAAFDDLIRQSQLEEAALSGILIELELDGHAVREVDGRWRRG